MPVEREESFDADAAVCKYSTPYSVTLLYTYGYMKFYMARRYNDTLIHAIP